MNTHTTTQFAEKEYIFHTEVVAQFDHILFGTSLTNVNVEEMLDRRKDDDPLPPEPDRSTHTGSDKGGGDGVVCPTESVPDDTPSRIYDE